MADQPSEILPETITRLRESVDSALTMLAGMQLDVFTPLKDGPLTLEQEAEALGGVEERARGRQARGHYTRYRQYA